MTLDKFFTYYRRCNVATKLKLSQKLISLVFFFVALYKQPSAGRREMSKTDVYFVHKSWGEIIA